MPLYYCLITIITPEGKSFYIIIKPCNFNQGSSTIQPLLTTDSGIWISSINILFSYAWNLRKLMARKSQLHDYNTEQDKGVIAPHSTWPSQQIACHHTHCLQNAHQLWKPEQQGEPALPMVTLQPNVPVHWRSGIACWKKWLERHLKWRFRETGNKHVTNRNKIQV